MLPEQFLRAAIDHEPALVDDRDAVTDALDHIKDVGAVDDGFALAGERFQQGLETDCGVCIESLERFVEEDDPGLCSSAAVMTTLRRIPLE